MLTFNSVNDAMQIMAERIRSDGIIYENKGNVTGAKTLKYPGVAVFAIANPKRRVLLCEKRRNNPFAQLFETLWVLSGSKNVETLSYFIPSAKKWADNGEEWRASYGSRLRYSIGLNETDYSRFYEMYKGSKNHCVNTAIASPVCIDQIKYVIDVLKGDNHSRRAVMTLWEPTRDCTVVGSKDYPCTNYINFWIEKGKLNCKVSMRSNDLIFGFSHVNMYEYSYLQELIALHVGVEVGTYYHDVANLHVYEKDLQRLEDICFSQYIHSRLPSLPVLDLIDLTRASRCVGLIGACAEDENFAYKLIMGNLEEQLKYLILYLLFKKWGKDKDWNALYKPVMQSFNFTDMKVAAHYWFSKKVDKDLTLAKAWSEVAK